MSVAGVIAAALRQEAPYAAEIQMGAQLILDFRGVRTGGRPYYWHRGTRYRTPENIPMSTISRSGAGTALDLSGNYNRFASGVPRITNRGWLSEEWRTNSLPNSVGVGAVVGTPGTMPSGWFFGGGVTAGLAVNVAGSGTEYGLPYLDLQFVGTTNAVNAVLTWAGSTAIAGTAGQIWTGSHFVRMVGGSAANVVDTYAQMSEFGSTSGVVNGPQDAISTTFKRQVATKIMGSGVTFVRNGLVFTFVSGAAVDITFRIYVPQCELGYNASSPILTSGALASHEGDLLNFGLTLPPSGTIFLEYEGPPAGNPSRGYAVAVNDGGLNRLALRGADGGANQVTGVVGNGVSNANLVGTVTVPGVLNRSALAYSTTEARAVLAQNGILYPSATQLAASALSGNLISVGQGGTGFNNLNTYITRFMVLATSAADPQLRGLTS
jgi:hypothetical protein